MKVLLTLLTFCMPFLVAYAQGDTLKVKQNIEKPNEITAYAEFGKNTIRGNYGTFSGLYQRDITNRWQVIGGINISTKNLYGIKGEGRFRIPIYHWNLYASANLLYNYYAFAHMHEYAATLSIIWESRYIQFTVGNTWLAYSMKGSTNYEPETIKLGFAANMKPLEHWWSLGLFIRNYDDFLYEKFDINWGLSGRVRIKNNWNLFGEFVLRPAGSMNQLAVKYDTFLKLGVKHRW